MGWLREEIDARAAVLLAVILAVPVAHAKIFMHGKSGPPANLMLGGGLRETTSGITPDPAPASFSELLYADANNIFGVNCLDFVYGSADGQVVNASSNNIMQSDIVPGLVVGTDATQHGVSYVAARDGVTEPA